MTFGLVSTNDINFRPIIKILFISVKFYFCELLNVLNIMFQIYFTDFFLKGYFHEVATSLLTDNKDDHLLTGTVFPLTSACPTFS